MKRPREGLALIVASPAAVAQVQPLTPTMLTRSTTELASSLYCFENFSARSIFIVGDAGVLVADRAKPAHAKALRGAVAAVPDQPERFVVCSHQHWDHVLGGEVYVKEGA